VRLLLTNDDGIHSPGIHALARHLVRAGYDVIVAAPAQDMSGASAAIGKLHSDQHIEVTTVEIPDADGLTGFAVAGPPGLAAMAGCLGGFGDAPDIIVSGINAGLNTGHSILHSGTVGAALTAQNFGHCGLAVSIEPTDPWHWETACEYALSALAWLQENARKRTVLNVNVPGCPKDAVKGVRWARLDAFGSVRAAVAEAGRNGLQFEFRATGATLDPESDTALVAEGYVTLTAIVGIAEIAATEQEDVGAEPVEVQRELRDAPGHRRIDIPAAPVGASVTLR
jgi:5'-nucleotidase